MSGTGQADAAQAGAAMAPSAATPVTSPPQPASTPAGLPQLQQPPSAEESAEDIKATQLHSTLRQRRGDAGPSACDFCRTSKSKCDKKNPCARCIASNRECKRTHVLLRTGRVSRAERMAFELSGLNFKTWRHRLAEQRRQYGHELRLTQDGQIGVDALDASGRKPQRRASTSKRTRRPSAGGSARPGGGDDASTARSRSSSVATSVNDFVPASAAAAAVGGSGLPGSSAGAGPTIPPPSWLANAQSFGVSPSMLEQPLGPLHSQHEAFSHAGSAMMSQLESVDFGLTDAARFGLLPAGMQGGTSMTGLPVPLDVDPRAITSFAPSSSAQGVGPIRSSKGAGKGPKAYKNQQWASMLQSGEPQQGGANAHLDFMMGAFSGAQPAAGATASSDSADPFAWMLNPLAMQMQPSPDGSSQADLASPSGTSVSVPGTQPSPFSPYPPTAAIGQMDLAATPSDASAAVRASELSPDSAATTSPVTARSHSADRGSSAPPLPAYDYAPLIARAAKSQRPLRLRLLADSENEARFPQLQASRWNSMLQLQIDVTAGTEPLEGDAAAAAGLESSKPLSVILQPDGSARLTNEDTSQPAGLGRFTQDWVATSATGEPMSPPWQAIRDNVPLQTLSLWPPLRLIEEDYDGLRQQASNMILNPVVPALLKRYFAQPHLIWPFLYAPTIWRYTEALRRHAEGEALDWTPLQIRQRQAIVLAISVAAVQLDDSHAVEVASDEPGADSPAETPGKEASTARLMVYSRLWAMEACKLAYALCQPRDGAVLSPEEKTLDLVYAARVWLVNIGSHPCLEGVVVLASSLALADPHFHMCMLMKSGDKIEEIEPWKRVMSEGLMAQNHHKLWRDLKYDGDLQLMLKSLGPLRLIPGELLDENQGGASSRACMWFLFRDVEFQYILARLCDSCLCNPPPDWSAEHLSAQREIEAEQIFNALKQWNEVTFTADRGEMRVGELSSSHERRALRYMEFSARAKLTAALDIMMCALESADTLGLEQLRLMTSPVDTQPDEADEVAKWVERSSFYRTETSFIERGREQR